MGHNRSVAAKDVTEDVPQAVPKVVPKIVPEIVVRVCVLALVVHGMGVDYVYRSHSKGRCPPDVPHSSSPSSVMSTFMPDTAAWPCRCSYTLFK